MKLLKLERKGCNPCKMVGSYLDSKSVSYVRIDVEDNPNIAAKYGVLSVPVTLLLNDDGDVVKKSVGFKPNEIEAMIAKL